MRAAVFPYRLPLTRPWVAAAATLTERRGALLALYDDAGRSGWGDCAPLPSRAEGEAVLAALAQWARRPASTDFSHLPLEARWAIESAQADLAAQRVGLPLWRYLCGTRGEIEVNAALGPLDDDLPSRLARAQAAGFRIAKIKVGLAPVTEKIARLGSLDTPLRLRLDANRAWSRQQAWRFLTALRDLPVDAVEEPLAKPDLATLAALQAELPYALAIDESLPRLGAEALIASRAVRRFVLKPARLGGIAATRAVATLAQAAGIEVVLTSVIDTAIGLTAAAHLAAALSPTIAHGLGTSGWLKQDIAMPLAVVSRKMRLPNKPGLGIEPN